MHRLDTILLSVRLPPRLVAQLERVIARLRAKHAPLRVSKSDALRLVIECGLRALEKPEVVKPKRRRRV